MDALRLERLRTGVARVHYQICQAERLVAEVFLEEVLVLTLVENAESVVNHSQKAMERSETSEIGSERVLSRHCLWPNASQAEAAAHKQMMAQERITSGKESHLQQLGVKDVHKDLRMDHALLVASSRNVQ
jgi:hypothetical protein